MCVCGPACVFVCLSLLSGSFDIPTLGFMLIGICHHLGSQLLTQRWVLSVIVHKSSASS